MLTTPTAALALPPTAGAAAPPSATHGAEGSSFKQALSQARSEETHDNADAAPPDAAPAHDNTQRPAAAPRKAPARERAARVDTKPAQPEAKPAAELAGDAKAADAQPADAPRHDADAPQPPDLSALLPGWTPTQARVDADSAPRATPGAAHASPATAHDRQAGIEVPPGATPAAAAPATPGAPAEPNLKADALPATPARAGEAPAAPTPALALAQPAPTLHAPTMPADAPVAPFQAQLAAAIDSPAFAPALGAQVSVFARDGVQQASLHLNPPEMGPITVQIEVVDTRVNVEFAVEQAATRTAIENGLPELASALRDSGLTLAGGGVFQQPRGQQRDAQSGGMPSRATRIGGGGVEAVALAEAAPRAAARRGVVDLYA